VVKSVRLNFITRDNICGSDGMEDLPSVTSLRIKKYVKVHPEKAIKSQTGK